VKTSARCFAKEAIGWISLRDLAPWRENGLGACYSVEERSHAKAQKCKGAQKQKKGLHGKGEDH
jgi:hypothetical protein